MNNLSIQKADVNSHFQGHWDDFYSHYMEIKSTAGKWNKCLCPLHDDTSPSLSFNGETGRFKCFGCNESGDAFHFYKLTHGLSSFPEVLQGICQDFGINGSGSRSTTAKKNKSQIVATYDYEDENGSLLFQVVRFDPKDFRQRRPDGKGGHIWNMEGVRRVPYRLSEVLQADLVLVPEGEKDVDNLRELGFTATTTAGGAEKWRPEYNDYFSGRDVVLLPDNDDPGRRHIEKIANSLKGVAMSIKVLQLPGLPDKGDVSDWIKAGGTKEDLEKMIAEAPEWEQGEDSGIVSDGLFELENKQWQRWPSMGDQAFSGFAGRFVEVASRKSEADPAAILITFLARFAVECGSSPFIYVGDSKHYARAFAVIVGASSKSRKGTSSKPVERLFKMRLLASDDIFITARVSPGPLSSGEGLIYAVRDEVTAWKVDKKTGEGEEVVIDPGVNDKRLFVMDEEFSSALIASKREGNTLSTIFRNVWDTGNLEPLTKNNRIRATAAHIGIVSHITLAELNRKLDEVEAFSGFANRILWVCARRQGVVPFPEPMPEKELASLQWELKGIIEKVREFSEMIFSEDAKEKWREIYSDLSKDHSGLVGAVIDRAESQVIRLAMIYSLLNSSPTISVDHLESALAVWRYCEASAGFIFAGREVNPHSQKILSLLISEGEKTATEIYEHFNRHIKKEQLEQSILEMVSQKKIEVERIQTKGRPRTIFKCCFQNNLREERELSELSLDFDF